ncbi:lipase/acyltransferase domain-containing protein [Mesorhizobium sp. BHbdii]
MSDLVIVLPGISGSVLAKDGKAIWNASLAATWRMKFGDIMNQIRLTGPEDESLDDLGDGIAASALVDNITIVPGLEKLGGYSILTQALLSRGTLKPGRNLFHFAYDWRRSNRVSSRKLARMAHERLARWRAQSGDEQAQIVFVAHSMGGLVARHFVECMEGWKITRSIIAIGTPFRGSGNSLSSLCNGYKLGFGPATIADATEALRSFDSCYQLLPTYPFITTSTDANPVRVSEIDLPNLSRMRAIHAVEFHQEISHAQETNASMEQYAAKPPLIRPVVGIEQPTTESATLIGSGLVMKENHPSGTHLGDGTVPRVSAVPTGLGMHYCTYVPNTHSCLQSDDATIDHLHGVLTERSIEDDAFRVTGANTIGLKVGDVHLANERFVVSAKPSRYVQYLNVTISSLEGSAEGLYERLHPDHSGYYSNSIKLGPGTYRIEVSGKGHRPAADVIMVVS